MTEAMITHCTRFISEHHEIAIYTRRMLELMAVDLTSFALALFDTRMALCKEHLIPACDRICSATCSEGYAQAFALQRTSLAELLRLRDVPIAGELDAFLRVASELERPPSGAHPWIVAVAHGAIVLFDPHAALRPKWGPIEGRA